MFSEDIYKTKMTKALEVFNNISETMKQFQNGGVNESQSTLDNRWNCRN